MYVRIMYIYINIYTLILFISVYLHRHIARASYDNWFGHWHHCLILEMLQVIQLLILVDGIEIGKGHRSCFS